MHRLIFLCLSAAISLAAQSYDEAAVERGKAQFIKTCSFCHGSNATGGAEGPNLILSSVVRHDKNGDLIGTVIREGRPAKGMPPMPLTDAQINDVVAYLHFRLTETDIRSPKRPKDYAAKLLLTGDATQGEHFFNQHCASCHSPSGDLKGIASRLEPPDLQAHMLYPGDLPETATVTDRQNRVFTGELIYQDPFTIEIRDKDGHFHSWPPKQVQFKIKNPLQGHLDLLPTYSESDMHNLFAYLETLH
jgi:cytochrome c oxidase cbb3-type subunit 3